MDGTIDKLPLSRAERHPEKAHRPDMSEMLHEAVLAAYGRPLHI